jgi:hypothetical protein
VPRKKNILSGGRQKNGRQIIFLEAATYLSGDHQMVF